MWSTHGSAADERRSEIVVSILLEHDPVGRGFAIYIAQPDTRQTRWSWLLAST
jgi:hypothetical protein